MTNKHHLKKISEWSVDIDIKLYKADLEISRLKK